MFLVFDKVHISLTMDHAETPRRDPMIKVSQLQTYGCSGHTFHTQQPNANGISGQFHRKYLPRSQNAFCKRRLLGIRPGSVPPQRSWQGRPSIWRVRASWRNQSTFERTGPVHRGKCKKLGGSRS
jgi:hypothetical protein